MRGWVGVRLGVFLVQSGRFLVVQKFIFLNLRSNIWILAPCIWVLAPCIWILAPFIWFLAPNFENRFFWRVCGGGGWVPQDLQEVSSLVSGKNIPPTPCKITPMGGNIQPKRCYRIFFLAGFFFVGIFPPLPSPLFVTVTELREQGSMVATEPKGERASNRSQENGRERSYDKLYFSNLRKPSLPMYICALVNSVYLYVNIYAPTCKPCVPIRQYVPRYMWTLCAYTQIYTHPHVNPAWYTYLYTHTYVISGFGIWRVQFYEGYYGYGQIKRISSVPSPRGPCPEPRKMAIIIARRWRGTWEGALVATWCSEWICRKGGGLVHPIVIIPPTLISLAVAGYGSRLCTLNTSNWPVLYQILWFFQFSSFSSH